MFHIAIWRGVDRAGHVSLAQVKRVYPGGLLSRWNDRVPQLEVKPHDRVVAVNDKTTAEGMGTEAGFRPSTVGWHMAQF